MRLNLKYEQYRLDNGLNVILHHDPSTPIASVNVWYHVGSWNERPGKTGFAHLFEHMMFQGSENVGSEMHFRLLQSIGSSVNGSTSFNRTNYFETVPSHHLELALWLEADRMGFLLPSMTQEKLDNQREVVKNERRQRVDNQPYGTWLEKMLALAYPKDFPYHWPVIGYMDDLDAATLDDIKSFFKTYYSPANASLCVAGDFNRRQVMEWIEHYFGVIRGVREIPPVSNRFEGAFRGEKREVVHDNIQLPRIYMAYHIPAYGSDSWYAADFLADVLSSGKSARFYYDLVYTKQVAQSAYAFTFGTEGTALFVVVATAQQGTTVEELQKALDEELAGVIEKGFRDDEMQRVKNQIEAQQVRELQSVESLADTFNRAAVQFKDPGYINREPEIYAAITRKQVESIAQTYIKNENRIVLHYLPEGRSDG